MSEMCACTVHTLKKDTCLLLIKIVLHCKIDSWLLHEQIDARTPYRRRYWEMISDLAVVANIIIVRFTMRRILANFKLIPSNYLNRIIESNSELFSFPLLLSFVACIRLLLERICPWTFHELMLEIAASFVR